SPLEDSWRSRLTLKSFYQALDHINERCVVTLCYVVVVPEPRLPDSLAERKGSEPGGQRRVQGRLLPVAQQSDRVSLDQSALAVAAWIILDLEPEERHSSDIPTDGDLELLLLSLDVLSPTSDRPSHFSRITANTPRYWMRLPGSRLDRLAHK